LSYQVEIQEVEPGGFRGTVIFTGDEGERKEIGQTPISGMKPKVEELARAIAERHKQGPELVDLDV